MPSLDFCGACQARAETFTLRVGIAKRDICRECAESVLDHLNARKVR